MRIWIDGYEANVFQRLGSGQVAYELIKNFEQLDFKNDYTVLLPGEPVFDMPKEREGFRYKILRPRRLWTRIALPIALYTSKKRPDIFFTPTHYGPWLSPVKRVITIFDLSYLYYPQMFKRADLYKLNNWTKSSIRGAEHIITISQSVKRDIIKYFSVSKDKISVCYPGYNAALFRPIKDSEKIEKVCSKYKISGEYIIFIGTIQPRKNIVRLIEAFKKIENLKLVIVGKTVGEGRQGWMFTEILNKPKELGIEDKVIFTGYVEDSELPYLVNGAKAFILPSLWEGFGIPVVDAMACGKPVIVSNVSSLPEVVGEAGLLIDPLSTDQIEQAVRTVTSDKKLAARYSKRAIQRAKKYSWRKMAKEVIKVFESM